MSQLEDILKALEGQRHPPVHLWNPDYCGEIDMVIHKDGTWSYMGTPIGRQRMVNLFASVLRFEENGRYYLVTPVEKIGIQVEDVPFVTTLMDILDESEGPAIHFETNVGDKVIVDQAHPLEVLYLEGRDEPRPYVTVRSNLKAKINRANFYELVENAVEVENKLCVNSRGGCYSLGDISDV
ncbi:DUF1285 domain-containing protein [Temperatibacter marinus]|uniref:DUF1285 domain-containing protein n=1 Tax=Temperatibacter marinus TaxID=1456591 RepID=A0AA52EE21_9PROT|nr:DUF1285 domain-containing protein [Temperatibacter marinus]WND01963.1 DUF1285 domain-containing protein [Temperatibacter marinus]